MLDLWPVRHAESVGNLDGTRADTFTGVFRLAVGEGAPEVLAWNER
jgi:hypothetical protein